LHSKAWQKCKLRNFETVRKLSIIKVILEFRNWIKFEAIFIKIVSSQTNHHKKWPKNNKVSKFIKFLAILIFSTNQQFSSRFQFHSIQSTLIAHLKIIKLQINIWYHLPYLHNSHLISQINSIPKNHIFSVTIKFIVEQANC